MQSYQQGSLSSDATPLCSNRDDASPSGRNIPGSWASLSEGYHNRRSTPTAPPNGNGTVSRSFGSDIGAAVNTKNDTSNVDTSSNGAGSRGSIDVHSPSDRMDNSMSGIGTTCRALRHPAKRTGLVVMAIAASILALLLCLKSLLFPSPFDPSPEDGTKSDQNNGVAEGDLNNGANKQSSSLFDKKGRFVLEDFDAKPAFSDFLPGVAGIYGKPIWSFYINRAQCIASFGVRSKDDPIMEFYPANKAYQNTAMLGFRTFIQGVRGGRNFFAEPFSPAKTRFGDQDELNQLPKRTMYVGASEMQIQEIDYTNKIETNVTYFTLPEEDFGAFVRRTTITNLDKELLTVSMLDGLARMEPAGGKINDQLKNIGRTLEGWFGVYQAHDDVLTMPFYRMSTEARDTAAVKIQQEGHYVLSFIEGGNSVLLPIVYDPSKVFGEDTMMQRPVGLLASSVAEILKNPQYGFAKTSSAFAAVEKLAIPHGKSVTIASFFGKAGHIMDVPVIARRITSPGFVQYKFTRAIEMISQITAGADTVTSHQMFNGHVQQMYLDNSLRGGIPIILGETDDRSQLSSTDEDERLKVYHLFSRVHGDLERDYNNFVIEPTFFSQGPGNFRDVAQNRRNDVVFNPRIGAFNLKTFLSYIQADGYQPNSVEAVVFTIKDRAACDDIATRAVGHADGVRAQRETLSNILNSGPFRPGQLFLLMEENNIELIMNRHDFVDLIASEADVTPMAVFSAGFWADHWTYYMDFVSNFLSIYPDMEEEVMYDDSLPYFYSPASVRPRSEKYVLSVAYGGKGKHVRQLGATVLDERKKKIQQEYFNSNTGWFDVAANWQHDDEGVEFRSSPIAKLFVLATIKFATRDAYGMGIEYEGGKPGWNDAMNGLVGMIGSGMPETYELHVLISYILSVVKKYQRPLNVPSELMALVDKINLALEDLAQSGYVDDLKLSTTVPRELFQFWDTVSSAREEYRAKTALSFSGAEHKITADQATSILNQWKDQIEIGISRSLSVGTHGFNDNGTSGISPTYFSFNVTEWKKIGKVNEEGHPLVIPITLEVGKFPLFLEGPVRMMKTVQKDNAYTIYSKVKNSALRDHGLNMYTISASLKGQSYDMGRMMSFTPGWLENQSVWFHMSYKFYLELIRKGLFKEFFEEMVSGGMLPFMKPDEYGRSLMECSSFIASSAFEDPTVQGRGFAARLSGATAEFLSMWSLMFIGPKPFIVDKDTNKVYMQLRPALPLWLFEANKSTPGEEPLNVGFKLFSSITVTYHNSARRDIFGIAPERYEVGLRDGSIIKVEGPSIPPDLADKIRRVNFVDYIDAYF